MKQKLLCFDFRKGIKEEKDIASMDFAEYLSNAGLSENSKVCGNESYCYIGES